jgi:hypothetical protein
MHPMRRAYGGFDAARRLKGRKRHMVVNTDGRLLMVNLTVVDMKNAAGPEQIIKVSCKRWSWLKHLFAEAPIKYSFVTNSVAIRCLLQSRR